MTNTNMRIRRGDNQARGKGIFIIKNQSTVVSINKESLISHTTLEEDHSKDSGYPLEGNNLATNKVAEGILTTEERQHSKVQEKEC